MGYQGYKGYTPAQGAASRRYNDANYESLSIRIKKGRRNEYKAAAEVRGMSLAGFVQVSMDEYIQNHPAGDSTP